MRSGYPARRTSDLGSGSDGMTLIEVLMALLVVGVILSGLASVTIGSLRGITIAESEIAATALAQEEIERLQTLAWDDAGLYSNEIADAPESWTARLDDDGKFDGAELIELSSFSSPTDRSEQVPLPVGIPDSLTVTRAGLEFRTHRYVTWVDRTNDGVWDTRRFTVVVEWLSGTTPRSISVSGERTPTQAESASTLSGVRLLQFLRTPDPTTLDDAGQPTSDITVQVRLNRGVTNGRLRYHTAQVERDGDGNVTGVTYNLEDHPMDASSSDGALGHAIWTFTLPGGDRFVDGVNAFQFTALDGTDPYERYASIVMRESGVSVDYPIPPSVTGAAAPDGGSGDVSDDDGDDGDETETVPPGTPDVEVSIVDLAGPACVNGSQHQLTQALELTVTVKGLLDTDTPPIATFQYETKKNAQPEDVQTATENLTFVTGNSQLATYELVLAPASHFRWAPEATISMSVAAKRDADDDNDAEVSNTVTVEEC